MAMNFGLHENYKKILEYKDWRNFQKEVDKAVLSTNQ